MRCGTRELAVRLRALPRIEPNRAWRERARRRLMDRFDANVARSRRRWAIYAGRDDTAFADAVHAAGADWRPVAVEPVRLMGAVRAIQPDVVVIDAALPRRQTLVQEVGRSSAADAVVLAQPDLGRLKDLLASR